MVDIWLKFTDESGETERVAVGNGRFAVGRHSANNLSIPDGRLSREHILIESFDDVFVVSDRGSSNGTELNGQKLIEPTALKNGDKLSLGGLDVEVEITSDTLAAPDSDPPEMQNEINPLIATKAGETSGGLPLSFFYIAPVLALVVLALAGLLMLSLSGKKGEGANSNFVSSIDPDAVPKNRREKNSDDSTPITMVNAGNSNTAVLKSNTINVPMPTSNPTDTGKVEQNAAAFLRHIAQNDTKAFVTGEQAQIINTKINSLRGSSAIADNIASVKKNVEQIKSLASARNLKPQFLAAAAITKLGSSRGDAMAAAQSLADVMDKLGTQIGNERGEDCLLMIAALDQGQSGDFMKMRNMLQDLANKSTASSREIRTIWFLHKNGKISEGEYDLALRFLAIGTIMQNPRDFNVNVEAISF